MLALLCGCAATQNLPAHARVRPSPVKSILILGVAPASQVQISPGRSLGEHAWLRPVGAPVAVLTPERGYIVVPLDPTAGATEYGISLVAPARSDIAFLACSKSQTVAFALPPSEASYAGDLTLESGPNGVRIGLAYRPEQAEHFIRERYPALLPDFRPERAREKVVHYPAQPELPLTIRCLAK